MKINDLIADLGKQLQLKQDVVDILKKHTKDPEQSARLAWALIEIGMDAFRAGGMCPHALMMLTNMIAHGSTTETGLQALMLITEEDDVREQLADEIEAKTGQPAPPKKKHGPHVH